MKGKNKAVEFLIATLKFIPLIIFAVLIIVFKLDLLLAAPIATFAAVLVYMIVNKGSFTDGLNPGLRSAGKLILVFFILMFAYGVAECFMATGVGAALIRLSFKVGISGRTVAPVALLITSLLSIATGSSWGTFAACAPIFLWLGHLVGGDNVLTVCAIAGGACFGDNIGMISDVTVLSCGMQDVKIIDRLKHQAVWSFGCLFIALIIFYFMGFSLPTVSGDVTEAIRNIPAEVYDNLMESRPGAVQLLNQVKEGVPFYMAIPMLVVIIMSFMKVHTLLCLGAGMVSSLLLGLVAGTVDFSAWLNELLLKGFADAGSWVIVMMLWIAAFGGIMNVMGAFDPLVKLVVKLSPNTKFLMGWCGVLCFIGNMALADESAQVVTMSPIVRKTVEDQVVCETEEDAYKFRLRLATFTSAMGIYGSELVPWHCFPVFFASIATAVYPLHTFTPVEIISKNFTSFLVVGTILVLTFTGLDRFIPGFGLPKTAKLKKQIQKTEASK